MLIYKITRYISIALVWLLIGAQGKAADVGTAPESITARPWEAAPKKDSWWTWRHNLNIKAGNGSNSEIIFYGDSLTEGWGKAGKYVFEKEYMPRHALNFGIGGDGTSQIIWRLTNGECEGLRPKLVVLMIGTNNLYRPKTDSNDDVVKGVKAVLDTFQSRLPTAKILLLGILPRKGFSERIVNINKQISAFDDKARIRFLDMGTFFQTQKGELNTELYVPDMTHLSAKGYEKWAEVMAPLLNEMYVGDK